MPCDLAGENVKEDPICYPKAATGQKTKVVKAIEAAGAFLMEHETVRIVVCINTHCMEEDGRLVWLDADEDKLGASTMQEVGVM